MLLLMGLDFLFRNYQIIVIIIHFSAAQSQNRNVSLCNNIAKRPFLAAFLGLKSRSKKLPHTGNFFENRFHLFPYDHSDISYEELMAYRT